MSTGSALASKMIRLYPVQGSGLANLPIWWPTPVAEAGTKQTVRRRTYCPDLSSPSHEEVDNEDDQQHAANATSHYRAPVIVPTTASEKEQQNQNNEDEVHMRILLDHYYIACGVFLASSPHRNFVGLRRIGPCHSSDSEFASEKRISHATSGHD